MLPFLSSSQLLSSLSSKLLTVFLSNFMSVVQNFSLFPPQLVFSISPVFISYTFLSPLSVSPCSLLLLQPGLLLCLQLCIHISRCCPSHDGCTHLKSYLSWEWKWRKMQAGVKGVCRAQTERSEDLGVPALMKRQKRAGRT